MANNKAWQVIQTAPFIGGLNTEINDLQDATQYTSDELNMVIKNNGTRARRLGIDYEEGYKLSFNTVVNYIDVTVIEDGVSVTKRISIKPAFSCFEWQYVAEEEGKSYIVIQAGPKLYFYNNLGAPFSQDQVLKQGAAYEVDLSTYKLSTDPENVKYAEVPVSFTNAYGGLFICSKEIKPFCMTSLEMKAGQVPVTIPATAILDITAAWCNKAHREYQSEKRFFLDGVEVGTSQVLGRASYAQFPNTDPHLGYDDFDQPITEGYYGDVAFAFQRTANYYARWWNSLPANKRRNITATAITPYSGDYPTEAEEALYGIDAKEYLKFTCPVGPIYSGITIRMEARARSNKMYKAYAIDYIRETRTAGYIVANVQRDLQIQIRDFKGTSDIYNNSTDLRQGEGITVRPVWPVSESDMTSEEIAESRAHIYNLWNQGWGDVVLYNGNNMSALSAYKEAYKYQDPDDNIWKTYYPANNYQWFLSKDPATQAFKPEELLIKAFGNTRAPTGKAILYYLEQDRASLTGLEGIPVEYPRTPYFRDIIAYAGRIWYLSGDTVLYSQVLFDDLYKADKCYQEADPTSEGISDLVDTDGGMIQIPELGEGLKFCLVGSALVVVGTESIQLISGGQNNAFTATAYTRGAMQAYTTISPQSFITTEYGTFFWSDVGIVLLSYQEGFQAQNITESTINTFYQRISDEERKNCIGVYNRAQKQITWAYGDKHNKLIVYDILKNAWTPFEIPLTNEERNDMEVPYIVGGLSLSVAFPVFNNYPIYVDTLNDDGEIVVAPVVDENGYRILVDDSIEKEDQTYKSAVFLCYDGTTGKLTFGYFDNLNCLDWDEGDTYGPGVNYNSYLVSHPINLNSTAWNKTVPYLLTYFRRTEKGYTTNGLKIYPSACQGAIQWDWNNSGRAGKWDAQQELYRYEKDTLLDNDHVFSKTRVYGGGRAFKVKLSSKDNNYFVVENVGFNIYGDARI